MLSVQLRSSGHSEVSMVAQEMVVTDDESDTMAGRQEEEFSTRRTLTQTRPWARRPS